MNFNTIPEALQDLKHRKHQLYGDPRQRSDLYADVRGFRPEAAISADGAV